MKIDSPLARLHASTKFMSVILASLLIVKMIGTDTLDPFGCILLLIFSLLTLYLTGTAKWLFQTYLVVLFPMFFGIFFMWILFNPDPGTHIFYSTQLYSGYVNIEIALWQAVFLTVLVAYYKYTKKIFYGFVLAVLLAYLTSFWGTHQSLVFARLKLLWPVTLLVSDRNVMVALTKVLGYAAMAFISLMFMMTTRDVELVGVLRQLRVPYKISLFASLFFRSLNNALIDYTTISQAQLARGGKLQKKNVLEKIRDYASMSVPLIAMMVRRSADMGAALEARGFKLTSRFNPMEFKEIKPFRAEDMLLISFLALMIISVFLFDINLTTALKLWRVIP